MRALFFEDYGEPGNVLWLDQVDKPEPKAGHIRIEVDACGLNPADWALCRGMFAGELPRGIGLDVAGTVDVLGAGVTGVAIGDRVFGVPAYDQYPSAGAAEFAVLSAWAPVPQGLDMPRAATLPMAVETAARCLDILAVASGQSLFVYGAGTVIGFAAVQMAKLMGAKVVVAAGPTFADRLQALGVETISYGAGMVERARQSFDGPPDLIFDAGPVTKILPDLVRIAGGNAGCIVTVSNHGAAAEALGVRNSFQKHVNYRQLGAFASLSAAGRFEVPIARVFPLSEWRTALELSLSGQARGKLMLLPKE